MERQYNILHAPACAFFSAPFYDDVARRWRGIGFFYLLLLLALTFIPTAVMVHRETGRWLANEGDALIGQLPPITIQSGKLSIPGTQPAHIRSPSTGKLVAVIDPSGQAIVNAHPDTQVVVTADAVFTRDQHGLAPRFSFAGVQDFQTDAGSMNRLVHGLRTPLLVLIYVTMVLGALAFRLVLAMIFAALGMALAGARRQTLTFAGGMRLAMMAFTPAILLATVLEALRVSVFGACATGLAMLLISAGYMYFAVVSIGTARPPSLPRDPTQPQEPVSSQWD